MESLHASSSGLRADAPVFTPTQQSDNGANGAPMRRRSSAVGGRSFTTTSGRGGRGGGGGGGARGGGRSHPLPRGTTFSGSGTRRSSMSSISDAHRGVGGGPDGHVLKERPVENVSTAGATGSDSVDPTKPFHSKMSRTEAYKLRQAKASAAFVKKQRAKASQAAAATTTGTGVDSKNVLHADAVARKTEPSPRGPDSRCSATAFGDKGKHDGDSASGCCASGGESLRVDESVVELGEGNRSEQLQSAVVPPVSPLQPLATSSGLSDSTKAKPSQANPSEGSLQEVNMTTSVPVEHCDLSPSAMSLLSGAGSISESPEQSHVKGSDLTRRRLDPATPAANGSAARNPVPCELDEGGKCVHAIAAAAANAAATAAANAAAAAAAAASSAPGSVGAGPSAFALESGKWCEECAGLGLHIAALVAELKAGKFVDHKVPDGDRAAACDDDEKRARERDRPKSSWKRTVSNAMLGSTTGNGSGLSASEVAKLRADKAQLADENQVLRATVEYLFKKFGGDADN